MAHGKRRVRVTWRVANGLAHAFSQVSGLSVCGAFRVSETTVAGVEERCRPCEIAVDQRR